MWPWGHLAVGYVAYSLLARVTANRTPEGWPTIALALGTQFPDIVDKPLAWWFRVLPNGRSLAHSLLTASLLLIVLGTVAGDEHRWRTVAPFGFGYLSHLLADGFEPAVTGAVSFLGYLFWPLVPAIEYPTEPRFLAHVAGLSFTPFVAFELLATASAIGLWIHDGKPGLSVATALTRRLRSRVAK